MEQKEKNSRGRPRQYDPDAALDSAMQLFWSTGFAETSLDDLGAAMGMKRPSIYAAFGDKAGLFAKTLHRYEDAGHAGLQRALNADQPLRQALRSTFNGMATQFGLGETSPRGCLLFTVAASEAAVVPGLDSFVAKALQTLEKTFEVRFERARTEGELGSGKDPADLARLASSLVHSLATRIRTGEGRRTIEHLIEVFLDVMCGADHRSQDRLSDGRPSSTKASAIRSPRKR